MADPQLPTYYDVLQVERDASPQRIRQAYRKLAQKYHPDKMPGNANASRAMAAINAAYGILSDAETRAEHDRWIRAASRPSRPVPLEPVIPTTLWRFMHPAISWAWYLLFTTLLVATGTVATAIYLTSKPAPRPPAASAPAHALACPVEATGEPTCVARR